MKKIISIMLCIMLSVSMMTACGSKESDNDKKDVGSETKQDVFTYDLKGVTVAMNENMEPLVKKLGDADNYFESDSCAFQGKDKVYTYGSVKITTYPKDNKDYVYTIELLDDTVSTPEGISIGSDKRLLRKNMEMLLTQLRPRIFTKKETASFHLYLMEITCLQ